MFRKTFFRQKFIHPPNFPMTLFYSFNTKCYFLTGVCVLHVFHFYTIPGPSTGPSHRTGPRGSVPTDLPLIGHVYVPLWVRLLPQGHRERVLRGLFPQPTQRYYALRAL